MTKRITNEVLNEKILNVIDKVDTGFERIDKHFEKLNGKVDNNTLWIAGQKGAKGLLKYVFTLLFGSGIVLTIWKLFIV